MLDGSLAAERDAAEVYARMAKTENTRRAFPLPGSGADVAAVLASERGRGLTPER